MNLCYTLRNFKENYEKKKKRKETLLFGKSNVTINKKKKSQIS